MIEQLTETTAQDGTFVITVITDRGTIATETYRCIVDRQRAYETAQRRARYLAARKAVLTLGFSATPFARAIHTEDDRLPRPSWHLAGTFLLSLLQAPWYWLWNICRLIDSSLSA